MASVLERWRAWHRRTPMSDERFRRLFERLMRTPAWVREWLATRQ